MQQRLDVTDRPEQITQLLSLDPPRATRFIVTVYGDVVEPRGGTLWIGTLIEACAVQGISESLVRTAVSRLVASGRLAGERSGRRSFYRLTAVARREFVEAARILFAPAAPAQGWLVWAGGSDVTLSQGWVKLGDGIALAPNRSDLPRPAGLMLQASEVAGVDDMPGFASRLFDVEAISAGYAAVVARFQPLLGLLRDGGRIAGAEALALRLRLVDEYRAIALRDPRLPATALPQDWAGQDCRALFVDLYRRLSPAADQHIGTHFQDSTGLLLPESEGSALRLERLQAEAKSYDL